MLSTRGAALTIAILVGCASSPSSRVATDHEPSPALRSSAEAARCRVLADGGTTLAEPDAEHSFTANEGRSVLLVGGERFELDVDSGFSSRRDDAGRRVVYALGRSMHVASLDGDAVAIDGESSEESPPLTTWDRASIRTASGVSWAVLPFRGEDGVFAPLVIDTSGAASTFVGGRGSGRMSAATSERALAFAFRDAHGIVVLRLLTEDSPHAAGEFRIPREGPVSEPRVAFVGPRIVVAWTELAAEGRSSAWFAVVTPSGSIDVHRLAGAGVHVPSLALGSDEERPVIAWVEAGAPQATDGTLVIAGLSDALDVFDAGRLTFPLDELPSELELVVSGEGIYLGSVMRRERRVGMFSLRCDLLLPDVLRADLPEPEPVHVSAFEPTEPDCDSPADCEERRACVVNALGGPLGCTGDVCCGASECVNGCVVDSDCPACRPRCARSAGAEAGTCTNPRGP